MMRLLGRFFDQAQEVVDSGTLPEDLTRTEIYRRLLRMGEDIVEGDWERFSQLDQQIESTIATLKRGGFEAEHTEQA